MKKWVKFEAKNLPSRDNTSEISLSQIEIFFGGGEDHTKKTPEKFEVTWVTVKKNSLSW